MQLLNAEKKLNANLQKFNISISNIFYAYNISVYFPKINLLIPKIEAFNKNNKMHQTL